MWSGHLDVVNTVENEEGGYVMYCMLKIFVEHFILWQRDYRKNTDGYIKW